MEKFSIKNYQLSVLDEKSKVYSFLSNQLSKSYFKLSKGNLVFALRGVNGMIRTNVPVEYTGKNTVYFSVDYSKWTTALQKFSVCEELFCSLGSNNLNLSAGKGGDSINLSIMTYEADSSEASAIDTFIESEKKGILPYNQTLVLNEEILSDFQLSDSLFSTQGRTNSIGMSATDIMYSDRSIVLKTNLTEEVPADFFKSMEEDTDHIYLHSFSLKLFNLLYKFNNSVSFGEDYGVIYWSDDNTELVFTSESRDVALPTQEQFEGIQPFEKDSYFEVPLNMFAEALNFFTGFYEGSAWKPLTIETKKDEDVLLSYSHPTAELKKTLNGVKATADGRFIIDSETMMKLVLKIKERFKESSIKIFFDEEAPGVYCTVEDTYEVILSKLSDD